MSTTGTQDSSSGSADLPMYGRYGRVVLAITLGLLAAGGLLLLLFFVAIQ